MAALTVFVKSTFIEVGEYRSIDVPTGQTKKNMFGKEVPITRQEQQYFVTGKSDCKVDGVQLARDTNMAVLDLESKGFRVVSITPIVSGHWNASNGNVTKVEGMIIDRDVKTDWFAYGFSYTAGVMIIAMQ